MSSAGHPLRAALLAQAGGIAVAGLALLLIDGLRDQPLLAVLIQAFTAAAIALARRAPRWWVIIHLGFFPLVLLARRLHLPPVFWLAGFVLLWLIFGRTDKSRVPLYLTNAATAERIASLLRPGQRMIDLGCGDGGLLARLARARPDCRFVGVEHALLTWAWARLRCQGLANVTIRRGSLWDEGLRDYDLVYAFLSPAPMPRLWGRARTDMKPGALLVSNSFPVEDARPEQVIEVDDRRRTHLHCYRPVAAGSR